MILVALLLSCPWLNWATAAGVLGGPVKQAGCSFTRGSVELRIETGRDFEWYAATCRSESVPLRAIGTEALACRGEAGEQVVSKVRDRAFLVRITANDREKVRKVAEMVAGAMF
jgi:hypothetical protein